MTDDVVTLHVWRVAPADVTAAIVRLVRLRSAARKSGARFVKALGTADTRFTPLGATPTRWAMVSAWPTALAASSFAGTQWWAARALESAALTLQALSCRGQWGRREPFVVSARREEWTGPIVVLTRSRVRIMRATRFYRAVPPISADLQRAPGLRAAFGIGEAPALWQGTVSVWDDATAMQRFVRTDAHRAAARDTARIGWYAEDLFAQFALVSASGTIDGRSVA